jgi:hypothetical protein
MEICKIKYGVLICIMPQTKACALMLDEIFIISAKFKKSLLRSIKQGKTIQNS